MTIDAPTEQSSGHRALLADGAVVLVRRPDPDVDAVIAITVPTAGGDPFRDAAVPSGP